MRTIIIWDQCGQEPICFFVTLGDYSHLDRVYVNGDNDNKKINELLRLIYKNPHAFGDYAHEDLEYFPELQPGDKVIVAGFLP